MKALIKVSLFILLCLVSLSGHSDPVQAVTHNFYYDPQDGVCIFYATTTTDSVTVTVGDRKQYEGYYVRQYLGITTYDPEPTITPILYSGSSYESSVRRWASKTIMTGLNPGTSYSMYHLTPAANRFWFADLINGIGLTVITEPNKPTNPTFSNITKNSVTINWTANGNGSATKYRLYRSKSSSGPWTLIYDGPAFYYSDTGLESDTTYYYLLASYVGSTEYFVDVASVTTVTDPTISAALAAKTASETAMLAANEAKRGTDTILSRLDELEARLNTATADTEKPEITEFSYIIDKATVVLEGTAKFYVKAWDNRSAYLQYRYKVNGGEYSLWSDLGDTVEINLGSAGYKTIVLEVRDESGNIASKVKGIFRL